MDRSTPIYLIRETYEEDEYGVLKPKRKRELVYANVTSVSASEWFEGGRAGLNPEYRMTMFGPDYCGEEELEYNDRRYAIYRIYRSSIDRVELYVQRKKGSDHAVED